MHTITYACSCCGEVVDKDTAADHMLICEKHPYSAMKRRAEVAEQDADRLAEEVASTDESEGVDWGQEALALHATALEARK